MPKPGCFGDNWLLVRGLCRESAHWGSFLSKLRQVFPQATINTVDLPGAGIDYQADSPDSIPAIMQSVRQKALQAGYLKQPVSLLALSMGGMLASEWLARYPDEIATAVLVNSSHAGLSPFYQRLRWQSYLKFAGILLQTSILQREAAIVRLISNNQQSYAETIALWSDIQRQRPVTLKNGLRQIYAAARYRPAAFHPKQPVLLINSRGDRLVSPVCSKAIQQQWQCELYTHDWAGHDLALDDGDWLATQLQNWVTSNSQ